MSRDLRHAGRYCPLFFVAIVTSLCFLQGMFGHESANEKKKEKKRKKERSHEKCLVLLEENLVYSFTRMGGGLLLQQ